MCYETLAYEGMKPAKLKRHMETKHKEYMGKPTGFFERKRDELTQHMMKEAAQEKMLRLLSSSHEPQVDKNKTPRAMLLICERVCFIQGVEALDR